MAEVSSINIFFLSLNCLTREDTDDQGYQLIDHPEVPELGVPDHGPEYPGEDGAHQGGDQHASHKGHTA